MLDKIQPPSIKKWRVRLVVWAQTSLFSKSMRSLLNRIIQKVCRYTIVFRGYGNMKIQCFVFCYGLYLWWSILTYILYLEINNVQLKALCWHLHCTFLKLILQNISQMHKWKTFRKNSNKIGGVPHVSWWKIGNHAIAMSESPTGVVIYPNMVEQKGTVKYLDTNLGYGSDVTFANNPAHEHTERDGTLWSTVAVVRFVSRTRLNIW